LPGIRLRPVKPCDEPFLCAVYCSTRMEELAVTGWPDEQKQAFLEGQHRAQHQHYQTHYSNTEFSIILVDDAQAGRLYVARWPQEIRIVDIALLPEYRAQGIGSKLLLDILSEAADADLPVRIHVEIFNPALRLYERLGFRSIEDKGVYQLMEWVADRERRPS
jgi:ribosomal protein S18 acetylase RimI-like enzyme